MSIRGTLIVILVASVGTKSQQIEVQNPESRGGKQPTPSFCTISRVICQAVGTEKLFGLMGNSNTFKKKLFKILNGDILGY